jgi:carbonic anhydrase
MRSLIDGVRQFQSQAMPSMRAHFNELARGEAHPCVARALESGPSLQAWVYDIGSGNIEVLQVGGGSS